MAITVDEFKRRMRPGSGEAPVTPEEMVELIEKIGTKKFNEIYDEVMHNLVLKKAEIQIDEEAEHRQELQQYFQELLENNEDLITEMAIVGVNGVRVDFDQSGNPVLHWVLDRRVRNPQKQKDVLVASRRRKETIMIPETGLFLPRPELFVKEGDQPVYGRGFRLMKSKTDGTLTVVYYDRKGAEPEILTLNCKYRCRQHKNDPKGLERCVNSCIGRHGEGEYFEFDSPSEACLAAMKKSKLAAVSCNGNEYWLGRSSSRSKPWLDGLADTLGLGELTSMQKDLVYLGIGLVAITATGVIIHKVLEAKAR